MTPSSLVRVYHDRHRNSVLLPTGVRIRDEWDLSRMMIQDGIYPGHGPIVLDSPDVRKYEETYRVRISVEDSEGIMTIPLPKDHSHSQEDLDRLIRKVESSPRFGGEEKEIDRIIEEVDFFERSGNILFILEVADLVDRFRKDNVVWGVGRGSSCASYIMYLLDVNAVNPLKHNIPFSELSKEDKDYE